MKLRSILLRLLIAGWSLAGITACSDDSGTTNTTALDPSGVEINRAQATAAFEYLNNVRQSPASFSAEIGADLSGVAARPALRWNDILAQVAEEKARDMAVRGYFDHLTPEGDAINIQIHEAGYTLPPEFRQNRSDNFFESIAAGFSTGVETIQRLILDEGVPDLGHRIHLLGMNDFHAEHDDIGIGFVIAPESEFGFFVCIIIARQEL